MADNPKLVALKPFFLYADEIEPVNPAFAFYLKAYGCERANALYKEMKSKGENVQVLQQNLSQWLTQIEQLKKKYAQELSNKEQNKQDLIDFIYKLFLNADNEEREDRYTKDTIRQFQVVSRYIEMLQFFGQVPQDLEEKKKYAKAKAVEINKKLKNPELYKKQKEDDTMGKNSFLLTKFYQDNKL